MSRSQPAAECNSVQQYNFTFGFWPCYQHSEVTATRTALLATPDLQAFESPASGPIFAAMILHILTDILVSHFHGLLLGNSVKIMNYKEF